MTALSEMQNELTKLRRNAQYMDDTLTDMRRVGKQLLSAVKLAYRKHSLNDDRVGWDELGEILCDAICEAEGDDQFILFKDSILRGRR